VGEMRWGWECERDWWGFEAAQGDGVHGHSDRVWIRGSPALPAPNLDAVRSPRPSTVPIMLFLHSLIATPSEKEGRKELKSEEEDTERETEREGQDGCLICFIGSGVLMFVVFF
jgi:hypothetical protein